MVSIRIHSIQDILKNINRRLSLYDILALFILALLLVPLTFSIRENYNFTAVSYDEGEEGVFFDSLSSSHIFASVSGKTYTYSWCQGAGRIKEGNKIFFITEESAKKSGRTLSRLCK